MKRFLIALAVLLGLAMPAHAQKYQNFPAATVISPTDLMLIAHGAGFTSQKAEITQLAAAYFGLVTGDCTFSTYAITCTTLGGLSPFSATNLSSGTLPAGRLPASGATPGTYADSTHVPQITVDATGRITGVTNVAISGGGGGGVTIGAAITGSCTNGYNLYNTGGVIGCQANGGGGGTVTTTGSPVNGNMTKFSGAATITNGDLTGAVTTSGALVTTMAANAVATSNITNANVTYAKIQSVAASRILGNPTGGALAPSEISLGSGLGFSGTTLAPSAPYTTNTVNASIGSLAGLDVFNNTGLTATLPGTGTLGANATAAVLNINSSPLTITNGQTPTGVPLSTTLHQFGWIQYLGTGSAAYALGFPGFGTITTNALPKFIDGTGATTASSIVDAGGGAVVGSATGGAQGAGTLNAAGLYVNGAAVTAATGCTVSGSQFQILTVNSGATGCTPDANASANAGALSLGASGTVGTVALGNATSGTVMLGTVTGALGSVTASLPANTGTIAELNLAQAWTATQTFAGVLGGGRTVSGTTDTLAATDCGKTIVFTAGTAVTVTIPASIVPATDTICAIAIFQSGAGQVAVNGTAVSAATLVSAHSYTKTFGSKAMIGLTLTTVGATTTAILSGDGA